MKNTMHPGGQDHLGAKIVFRYSLLASLIAGVIIGQTQRIVNAFWCLLLSHPMRCAALRRMRKRPPFSARSGEIAAGEADGFLWRGSATTPARSAGQRRVWGGNPNKYQTRGTNERSEIWATGRYLLSTTNAFPMPAHRSVTVQQIRQQKRICRSYLPDKRELTVFCFCDFRYCQL